MVEVVVVRLFSALFVVMGVSTNMTTWSVCSCRVYKHASNNFSY